MRIVVVGIQCARRQFKYFGGDRTVELNDTTH